MILYTLVDFAYGPITDYIIIFPIVVHTYIQFIAYFSQEKILVRVVIIEKNIGLFILLIIIDYIYLPSFLILLDEHLKIPNSAKMEVHGVKSSKQFSDLDLMPKTSINTNTSISNQSIVSIYDSSTRDYLPNSIKLSQTDVNKNEKKTMVRLIVA